MSKNKYYCKIDETIYNLKEVQELIRSKEDWKAIEQIVKIVQCDYGIAGNIFMHIKNNHDEIPPFINSSIQPNTTQSSQPKCPRCGSTVITTGRRGYSLLTGFIGSNKTVNRCANCGYSWKPGK